ncbi:MAG: nicotinate-nucleotide adenylyltransferase [Planctomycetota bacterium]|nr:nicotinate-nucleotide adenylyltransferase [Planctomycetota bacterium]
MIFGEREGAGIVCRGKELRLLFGGRLLNMRIGIFGGSFDPVHIGHIETAERVTRKYHLDRLFFVPAFCPPHKTFKTLTDGAHRLRMLEIAIKGNDKFTVEDVELKRGGVSYTVDTLRYFRRSFPQAELYFIIGSDSLEEILLWREIEEAMKIARFVTVLRSGFKESIFDRLKKVFGEERVSQLKDDFLREPPVAVSSSEIRERIKAGESVEGMLPQGVEKYIRQMKLYVK